jgi:hypothetical protein
MFIIARPYPGGYCYLSRAQQWVPELKYAQTFDTYAEAAQLVAFIHNATVLQYEDDNSEEESEEE